jgi:hypothetical protein
MYSSYTSNSVLGIAVAKTISRQKEYQVKRRHILIAARCLIVTATLSAVFSINAQTQPYDVKTQQPLFYDLAGGNSFDHGAANSGVILPVPAALNSSGGGISIGDGVRISKKATSPVGIGMAFLVLPSATVASHDGAIATTNITGVTATQLRQQ